MSSSKATSNARMKKENIEESLLLGDVLLFHSYMATATRLISEQSELVRRGIASE